MRLSETKLSLLIVFRAVDYAQRTNTIGSLRGIDVSRGCPTFVELQIVLRCGIGSRLKL